MMNFNARDWVRQILESKKKHTMPIITYPGLQLTGKKVMDLVTDGKDQAECVEVPRFSFFVGRWCDGDGFIRRSRSVWCAGNIQRP